MGSAGQRDCSLGVAVTARGEPRGLGQDSIRLEEGSGEWGEGSQSILSTPALLPPPRPPPQPGRSAGSRSPDLQEGKQGTRSPSIVWEGGEKLRPPGGGEGRTRERERGRETRGGRKAREEGRGRDGELEKDGERGGSDAVGKDKGKGAGERAGGAEGRRGGRGARPPIARPPPALPDWI